MKLTDDEIIDIWRRAYPDPGQNRCMLYTAGRYNAPKPTAELRRFVDLLVERVEAGEGRFAPMTAVRNKCRCGEEGCRD